MPLPTDPKTVFLGGLFIIAFMAVLYVSASIVLPLILAIVLKLLLQPFVRLLEGFHIPRPIGAILSVLLVLLAFGGTISMLAGPAAAWAGKLPEAIPKLKEGLSFLARRGRRCTRPAWSARCSPAPRAPHPACSPPC
jgi:predicted PurR-regulated permease PerM